MGMTPRNTGPFYDFSEKQWQQVRETHQRFCQSKDLDRPILMLNPGALSFSDVPEETVPDEEIVLAGPKERNLEMDKQIQLAVRNAYVLSQTQCRYDSFPTLYISREFYGHSQRLAEPFGTTTIVKGNGHAQAHPCIQSLSDVWHLKLKPLKECAYLSRSLEVLKYFVESTEGRYYIPHFVTTGACDTVNYATGSTQLLMGFYENPKAVHHLLNMATDIIIGHILECRKIAGDRLVSDHTRLLDGCYCICSEIRSQFSAEHYEEFEAPYLKKIGEAVGPLHIHVSGPIEQSVPATLKDRNIKHMKFWLKDSDLKSVVDLIGGQVSIDLFRNNCMPALSFDTVADFYRYIFETIRPETRLVIPYLSVPREFNKAYDAMEREGTLPEQVRKFGRLHVGL